MQAFKLIILALGLTALSFSSGCAVIGAAIDHAIWHDHDDDCYEEEDDCDCHCHHRRHRH